jgi:hypothetical protein
MGTSQAIVFVFFGQQYWEQFEVCYKTIPKDWNVIVFSDTIETEIHKYNFSHYGVTTPQTVFEKLTYRKNIHKLIDINQYSQIWYSDPDMLFTGDILAKYKDSKSILVSNEPFMDMSNEHFNGGFSDKEVYSLVENFAPAINGGLYCVPKNCYSFFEQYESLLNIFSALNPGNMATDQHALNNLFHRKLNTFELFDKDDVGFPTRQTEGKYVNHYIGMGLYKLNLMKDKLGINHD